MYVYVSYVCKLHIAKCRGRLVATAASYSIVPWLVVCPQRLLLATAGHTQFVPHLCCSSF